MAFDLNPQAPRGFNPNEQSGNESWRARGFINFTLPKPNGRQAKLGAIKLELNRADHVQLCEHLEGFEEGEQRDAELHRILGMATIRYNSAERDETGFDLTLVSGDTQEEAPAVEAG